MEIYASTKWQKMASCIEQQALLTNILFIIIVKAGRRIAVQPL
jgi:hypothetical protein